MTRDYIRGFYCSGVKGQRSTCDVKKGFRMALGADSWFTGRTDFFLSAFSYADDFREHMERRGTEAGFSGACFSAFLWFDIDRENDLKKALEDTAKLVEFFVSGVGNREVSRCPILPDSESILIFFSGCKGFHVGVPISLLSGDLRPSETFHQTAKEMALEVAEKVGVEIDSSIYSKTRLFRCPNTRHGKTGLYKIPISYWELCGMADLSGILERAKHPRKCLFYNDLQQPEHSPDDVLFHEPEGMFVPSECWQSLTNLGEKSFCEKQNLEVALLGKNFPRVRRETLEFLQHGAVVGERNSRLFNAVADCCRCLWSVPSVWSVFVDVGRKTGLSREETERTIHKAIQHVEEKGGCWDG